MSKPTSITLAIACFNASAYIEKTLRSVMRQTLKPDEILVIDDGSVDNSIAVINRFNEVKLLTHGHNRGIAAARNTAWQHANSEIITYIDADTIAHPHLLEILLECYIDDDIAGAGGQGLEAIQKTRSDRWRREVLFQGWGTRYNPDAHFLFGLCSSYRRSVLQELGGFDTFFRVSGEDMDFSFRLRRAGFRIVYHPEAKVDHLRADDYQSIKKMTYRHCYGGFLAQKKNHCYQNKLPLVKSLLIFMKQLFLSGLARGDLAFAGLTISLHGIVFLAWVHSRQNSALKNSFAGQRNKRLVWEGHDHSSRK
jgi:GT2 family glycosyltransferase